MPVKNGLMFVAPEPGAPHVPGARGTPPRKSESMVSVAREIQIQKCAVGNENIRRVGQKGIADTQRATVDARVTRVIVVARQRKSSGPDLCPSEWYR